MMPTNEVSREITLTGSGVKHRTLVIVFALMGIAGAAAFLMGIFGDTPLRAWQAFHVNYLFWTGLCFGTVLFSAILTITDARWGRPLKRLAEAPGTFLPISFAMLWVVFLGKDHIFPWIHHPIPEKKWWLDQSFLFIRDGLAHLALTSIAIGIIYHSVQRDLKSAAGRASGIAISQDDSSRHGRSEIVLAPTYALLYAFILSLFSIDLIMSLDPHWVSTLFGAYYFMGSFYGGLAAIVVLSVLSSRAMDLDRFIKTKQYHDLGKLMFGFCVVTGDFFYAQFLVIWYGNLPEETHYILLRLRHTPWETLAWTVLFVAFVIPFIILLSRRIKMTPAFLVIVSGTILVGMWLERFLLVAPSLWKGESIPLGFMELLVTAGFLGVVGLCVYGFLLRVPAVPVADPMLLESLAAAEAEGHEYAR